jgi:hypothetical protein
MDKVRVCLSPLLFVIDRLVDVAVFHMLLLRHYEVFQIEISSLVGSNVSGAKGHYFIL